jgi:thiol-disulfide isomerase/thioredoxin
MGKLNNVADSLISNPLVHVIILLFIALIILGIIRIVYPEFTLGAGVNAHVGTIKGNIEFEAFDNHPTPMFVMYYADWCGHCKRAKPHFENLMSQNMNGVKMMAIDADDKSNADLIKSQDIQGFPTIRYYPSGLGKNYQDYDGERTMDGFKTFLGRVLNQ